MLILTIAHIDITLEFFCVFLFYYVYTITCNLVTSIFVSDCRKVDVCA